MPRTNQPGMWHAITMSVRVELPVALGDEDAEPIVQDLEERLEALLSNAAELVSNEFPAAYVEVTT